MSQPFSGIPLPIGGIPETLPIGPEVGPFELPSLFQGDIWATLSIPCNPQLDDTVGNNAFFNGLCVKGNLITGGVTGQTGSFSLYEYNNSPTDYARLVFEVPPNGPYRIRTDALPVGVPTNRALTITATDDLQLLAPNNHILIQGLASVGIVCNGTAGYVQLSVTNASGVLQFITTGGQWNMDSTGAFFPNTDNALDLGKAAQRVRNIYVGTQILTQDGSATAPSYAFASSTSSGFYNAAGGNLAYTKAGTVRTVFEYFNPGIQTTSIGFGAGPDIISSGVDTYLVRDAGGILAQRISTSPQNFRIYNTFTDLSNYERLEIGWSANVVHIYPSGAGTGSASRELQIGGNGNNTISLVMGGTIRWYMEGTTGHLKAFADNTYDIGAGGANRPRSIYCADFVQVGQRLLNATAFGVTGFGIQPNSGGSMLYSGAGVPSNAVGSNGDFFFRADTPATANQRLYIRAAGAWVAIL